MKIITTLQFKSFVVFWHLDNDTRILFLLNNDWTTISDIIVSIYWFLFRLVLSTRSDYADYLYDNSSPSNLTLNRLHKIIDVKHNVSASLDEERIAFLGALAFICVWTAPFRWCILRLRKKNNEKFEGFTLRLHSNGCKLVDFQYWYTVCCFVTEISNEMQNQRGGVDTRTHPLWLRFPSTIKLQDNYTHYKDIDKKKIINYFIDDFWVKA